MKVDFIIVGQGLAGTLLANEFFRQNKTVLVFDDPVQPKASSVAAGLINPVVFRRMTKSWLVDEAFPQMETTFRQLEELLQKQLYFPGRMLRILSEADVGFWKEKVFASRLESYLDVEPDLNFRNNSIDSSFSFGCVNKSGRLDIQTLIHSFSEFLQEQNLIRREEFDYQKLTLNQDWVMYDDVCAEKIIFCEGPSGSENPFFKKLHFKHSKGEILELEIPGLHLDKIINGDVFIMPVGDNQYKVGATYSWDKLNWETTNFAREELLNKLGSILSVHPKLRNQKAGIRPTMHDRKPVIGLHPDYPQIGIFNGLGSKGVLLGPYFARQFANYLSGNSNFLLPEADIKRYYR